MNEEILSYVYSFCLYALLSFFSCRFFQTLLGMRYSLLVTTVVWFCFFFGFNLFTNHWYVPAMMASPWSTLQVLLGSGFLDLFSYSGTILLVFFLFRGDIPKKLAIFMTYLVLTSLVTYVSQAAVHFVLSTDFFLPLNFLRQNIMFFVSFFAQCFVLFVVGRCCHHLSYLLPRNLSFLMMLQSAFLLIFTYVILTLVDFLDVFSVLSQSGVLEGNSEVYHAAAIPITAVFCALGLASNLILVFSINHVMQKVLMEEQWRLQVKHYEELDQANRNFFSIKHDLKNHLITLSSLLNQGNMTEAKVYIQQLTGESGLFHNTLHTGNSSIDGLVAAKGDTCLKHGISLQVDLQIPNLVRVSDFDLSVLLGNALDNALNACLLLPVGGKPFITLESAVVQNCFICKVKNSYDPKAIPSVKQEMHGIGLNNMKRVAERNGGIMKVMEQEGIFSLSILLPLDRL